MPGRHPLFSIVIPALNEERHLPPLLESIFNQTYRPIEVLVVDDGSTDRTLEVVEQLASQLADPEFNIVLAEASLDGKPKGRAFARNVGIDRASGQIYLLLDADYILSDRDTLIQLSVALETNQTARFLADPLTKCWLQNNLVLDRKGTWRRHKGIAALAARKAIFDSLKFDETLGVGEDVDFVHQMRKAGVWPPTLVAARGSYSPPGTLAAFALHREWYGRTSLLWLKKHRSIEGFWMLAPAGPAALLLGAFIGLITYVLIGLGLAASFLAIVVLALAYSPVITPGRFAYLVLVRFGLGSVLFLFGMVRGILQLVLFGRIRAGRER